MVLKNLEWSMTQIWVCNGWHNMESLKSQYVQYVQWSKHKTYRVWSSTMKDCLYWVSIYIYIFICYTYNIIYINNMYKYLKLRYYMLTFAVWFLCHFTSLLQYCQPAINWVLTFGLPCARWKLEESTILWLGPSCTPQKTDLPVKNGSTSITSITCV